MFLVVIRCSKLQLAILLIFYLGSILAVSRSSLPILLLLTLGACLSAGFFRELNILLGRSKNSLLGIHFRALYANFIYPQQQIRLVLSRVSYFSEYLIVLDFKEEGGSEPLWGRYFNPRRFVVLWPDSLCDMHRRRLRRYLMFERK